MLSNYKSAITYFMHDFRIGQNIIKDVIDKFIVRRNATIEDIETAVIYSLIADWCKTKNPKLLIGINFDGISPRASIKKIKRFTELVLPSVLYGDPVIRTEKVPNGYFVQMLFITADDPAIRIEVPIEQYLANCKELAREQMFATLNDWLENDLASQNIETFFAKYGA